MRNIRKIDEIENTNYTVNEILNVASTTFRRLKNSGNLDITSILFENYMATLMQIHTKEELKQMTRTNYCNVSEKYILIKDLRISYNDSVAYTIVALDWVKYLNTFTIESYIYCLIEVIFWYKPNEIHFIVEDIYEDENR